MPLDLEIAAESSPGTQLNLWTEEYCHQKREDARIQPANVIDVRQGNPLFG